MKKYILSGLMGFGISVGCLLPPILHFVTGPLGPLIGGFFGGMRSPARMNGALVIGATMGICLSGFLIILASLIFLIQKYVSGAVQEMLSNNILTAASLWQIALIPFLIGTVLGTAGALLGSMVVRKSKARTDLPFSK